MEQEIAAAIERATTAFDAHQASISKSLGSLETRFNEMEKKDASRREGHDPVNQTWGSQMTRNDGFKAMAQNGRGTARLNVENSITTADTSGGPLIAPDKRTDPIPLIRRRLTILDLLIRASTSSSAVTIAKHKTRDNNPAFVAEGNQKPESSMDFEAELVPVLTMAHWLAASVQALDDAPQLQSIIDSELRYGLEDKIEAEILTGPGGSQRFLGLVTAATAFTAPFTSETENPLDRILQARAQMEAASYEATGIVLNPTDWSRAINEKDADGRYLSGGPFVANTPQLWGLPVVTSTIMPENSFLIGDFRRAATLYSRQEITVEVSTEHADFFTKNLVAVRAELRAGLAINDANALITGELVAA